MRTENWCGHDIRFVEVNDEWWAVLDDICDALDLHEEFVTRTVLDNDLMDRVKIDDKFYNVTNEIGICQMICESNCIEAGKFRRWSATVMQKLRSQVGLEQYEVMRMMESKIQDDIDHILDTLFYDEETGKLMQSVTVAGGDVEQVLFE